MCLLLHQQGCGFYEIVQVDLGKVCIAGKRLCQSHTESQFLLSSWVADIKTRQLSRIQKLNFKIARIGKALSYPC